MDRNEDQRGGHDHTATGTTPGDQVTAAGAAVDSLQRCMAQRENMQAIFNSLGEGILTVDCDLVVLEPGDIH